MTFCQPSDRSLIPSEMIIAAGLEVPRCLDFPIEKLFSLFSLSHKLKKNKQLLPTSWVVAYLLGQFFPAKTKSKSENMPMLIKLQNL